MNFSGMAGDLTGSKDSVGLLKTLSREEVLEVLSQGLGRHSDAALQTPVPSIGKRKETSISSDDTKSRTDYGEHSKSKPVLRSNISSESASRGKLDGLVSNVSSKSVVDSKRSSKKYSKLDRDDGVNQTSPRIDDGLSEEQELTRCVQVGRKKDFSHMERIKGKSVNVLQGLELYTEVFNFEEQRKIVDYIFTLQHMGQKGQLRANTYSEPRKWMRGKGRVTIQFGCCYNYALDKNGNPPGITNDGEVDPLPPLFKQMIKRIVRWQVLPATCVPDSCIVNIYEKGDCIPPHIDHHDFLRPFCTMSFLSECNILFGRNLKAIAPGEFDGPVSIPLPVGSVLVLNGNGADVAKHCVPSVPFQRISITFRKMHPSKLPDMHVPEIELMGIKPLTLSPSMNSSIDQKRYEYKEETDYEIRASAEMNNNKGVESLNF